MVTTEDEVRREPDAADPTDDLRYDRAYEAYVRLLHAGRLRCGENCPLHALGRCSSICW